jgi:hypothetical protein
MKKKAILWLFICPFLQLTHAQHSWEARYLPGFLVPHHADMVEMMAHTSGIEVGRQWKLDSGGIVEKIQDHPTAGIGITYFHLGKSVNGEAYTIQGFYEAGRPFLKTSSLRARLCVGAGYLTKQFNVVSNPLNRAIGSNINGFMQITTYVQTPIAKRTDMLLGIGLSHFSNGNWGQPNLGINLPSLLFGLKQNGQKNKYVHMNYLRGSNVIWEFSARMGKRQMSIDDPRNIATYMVESLWNYPHNAIRNWRGGINVFFDRTYLFEKFQPLPKGRIDQITEIALMGGHEYRVNKLGFIADFGVYLYRPDRSKRMYYEAVGLKYYVNSNWILMTRLKAHLTSADYFEWGVCYSLTSKQTSKPGFGNSMKWLFGGFKSQKNHNDFY